MSQLQIFDQYKASVTQFVEPVKGMTVTCKTTNAVALGTLKTIKEMQKQIEAKRIEVVDPHNQTVKQVNAYVKEILLPLDQAESFVKKQMSAFAAEENRKLEAERRALEEERRAEQQRLERIRMEQEAEQRRKADEERKKIEAAAKTEDEARIAKQQLEHKLAMEKQQAEAKLMRDKMEAEKAARQLERDMEAQRNKNTREVTKFEVENAMLLTREYLQPNESAIREAIKSGIDSIPGVRIWREAIVVSR